MCSQKLTSYNEMRLDIILVAHTKLRYRLIIQPTVRPQTPMVILNSMTVLLSSIKIDLVEAFRSIL